MNAISYEQGRDTWQEPVDEPGGELPGRPRRRLLTPASALLLALATAAIGFYVGIRVEKGQVSSWGTGGGLASLASRLAGTGGRTGTLGRRGGAGRGGLPSFPGGGFPGRGGISGTVANVNGSTIYVTEPGGNTVKLRLSTASKLACLKQHGVTLPARRPGSGAGGGFGRGRGPGNSKFRAAFKACGGGFGRFRPGAGGVPRRTFSAATLERFVTCVRNHGYTLPKPNTSGGPVFPRSIESSTKFQAAARACASLLRPSPPRTGTSTATSS
ncbi:MAG TPA: hypothetical protein VFP55_15050 [Solirubrobacteraceae bacterium]|nr:hypothetical protein [Solirubrobacteraceae bacterium]